MFTLEQIKEAQSKVKSAADFPAYIHEIKQLGVTRYDTYVSDGHTDCFGKEDFKASTGLKYDSLDIANQANTEQFMLDLKAHQQEQTDYLTFCNNCAKSGISKWTVAMETMTCTYYDLAGNEILVELVPAP